MASLTSVVDNEICKNELNRSYLYQHSEAAKLEMRTVTPKKVNTSLLEKWKRTLDDLGNDVKTWVSQEPDWSFTRTGDYKEIEEIPLGTYTVEVWRIQTPKGEVRWDPIARNYPGHGIVELYAWPTAYRVRLIHNEAKDEWQVLTDSGIYLRQPWDREHFVTLVYDLIGADSMIAAA